MRAFFSYGVALVIVLIVAAWLGTGTLIQGGAGPKLGERPVVSLIEPKGGPLETALKKTGLQAPEPDEGTGSNPSLSIAQREAKATSTSAEVNSVQVKTFIARDMPITVPVRGETAPKKTVTASAETTGLVASVNVVKGQHVKTGTLLCTLETDTRKAAVAQAQASLAQAKAGLAQAQADYDTNAQLRKKGLATPNSARPLEVALSSATASVTAAKTALDNANAELARTHILAKSDGVIQAPLANVGTLLSAAVPGSATCATIVQLDPILFTGSVPESNIGEVNVGSPAKVTTVTGATITGKISYIASVADDATRTFPIEIDLANPGDKIRAGITAKAVINAGSTKAQLLPQSVLTLDDHGTMGVRAVKDSKVLFYPVTIVNNGENGMWVTGLPDKVNVITVGQEFVQAGQTVKAVNMTDADKAAKPAQADGVPS